MKPFGRNVKKSNHRENAAKLDKPGDRRVAVAMVKPQIIRNDTYNRS